MKSKATLKKLLKESDEWESNQRRIANKERQRLWRKRHPGANALACKKQKLKRNKRRVKNV